MKLSIIIVNYNVKYFLEQCLCSIFSSKTNFEYEIIIVDNNSSDNSVEYLQNKFHDSRIKYIENNTNQGFSVANNQGYKISSGDYILLLNPDTVLGESVLQNVLNFYDLNKNIGAIGVKMINGCGYFLPESKRSVPTPWVSFCKISGLQSIFPKSKIFGKYSLLFLDKNQIHKVSILAGAFMMIPRPIIEKVGLLDEDFFMYGEDIDLSYRIEKAGYQNYYLPETILHYKGESTNKYDFKYIKAFHDAMSIFYKKHYPTSKSIKIINCAIWLKMQLVRYLRTIQIQSQKKIKFDQKILTSSKYSYEEIFCVMEKNANKKMQFLIYSPQSNITIGTKTIIQNKPNNVVTK